MLSTADRPVAGGRHRPGQEALPTPPTDAEKASYSDRAIVLILASSTISFGALLVSQAKFMLLDPAIAAVFGPFVVFNFLNYVLSFCVNVGTPGFDLAAHRALVRSWRPAAHPSLDVFLPVCGEPAQILRNTWQHVSALAAAYPGRTSVYVLDDAASAEVRSMADDFGFTYLTRPNRGWMKKAGNLRHGFALSYGEFILILDADFAVRPDLPAEILPYFAADPSLGIVQTPQYFRIKRGMSWMERGAGAVQELFFRSIEVSLDRHDGAICVGTCAMYRRVALEVNGGTTPIHHSEDLHTGFDLYRAGWKLRYVPLPLATGLCPADPDSFLSQQYRWCTGSVSLVTDRKFWNTKLSWRARCGYLGGFCYYLHTALFTFAAPLISLVLLGLMPREVELANYALIMPSIVYNVVIFPAWHRCDFGVEAFMAKMLHGWAHIFSLWDIARGRELAWQATGDSKNKSGIRRMWAGIVVWNGGTGIAWIGLAAWRIAASGYRFIPLLMFGLGSCLVTAMALAARSGSQRRTRREQRGQLTGQQSPVAAEPAPGLQRVAG